MASPTLPSDMVRAIAAAVRAAGQLPVETGGFILARERTTHANVLALAGERGVERRCDLFHVTGLALATLFEWADEHEMTVLAQWHSHRRQAFLSKTDLEHGFNVPGFISTVVPFYEDPSVNVADWGWWRCDGRGWLKTPAPQLGSAGFRAITFEQGAVREH